MIQESGPQPSDIFTVLPLWCGRNNLKLAVDFQDKMLRFLKEI